MAFAAPHTRPKATTRALGALLPWLLVAVVGGACTDETTEPTIDGPVGRACVFVHNQSDTALPLNVVVQNADPEINATRLTGRRHAGQGPREGLPLAEPVHALDPPGLGVLVEHMGGMMVFGEGMPVSLQAARRVCCGRVPLMPSDLTGLRGSAHYSENQGNHRRLHVELHGQRDIGHRSATLYC